MSIHGTGQSLWLGMATLGLSTESVYGYSISHIKRVLDTEPPELPLCRRGMSSIVVTLKGR